jgi:hypothetical protein
MAEKPDQRPDEFAAAAQHRRAVERQMSMSERLAALHQLCKQLAAMDAVAKHR